MVPLSSIAFSVTRTGRPRARFQAVETWRVATEPPHALAGLTNQSAVARRWNEAGLLTSEGVQWGPSQCGRR
jgi:hypothetical protein